MMKQNYDDNILIVFTVDVHYDENLGKKTANTSDLKSISLLPIIANSIDKAFSCHCRSKITWLVSDEHHVLKQFDNTKNMLNKYDEIGIHCTISKKFQLEKINDLTVEQYFENSIKMMQQFDIFPTSSRIMGCTSNNSIMSHLPKVGITVDSSAIPSRKKKDGIPFNWIDTPTHPYFPSFLDYRKEDVDNKNNMILEVPISTILTKASYDKKPVHRYLDFSFKNKVIDDRMMSLVQENNVIVVIIHPWLLMETSNPKELISYDMDEFVKNLNSLLQACDKTGKKVTCVTLSELRSKYLMTRQT